MPIGKAIHIDKPLSNVAVAAFDMAGDYVAGKVFPVTSADKQSDKYYVIDKNSWLLTPTTYRSPRTQANRIDWNISSDSYFCDNYALATDNALEDLSNADTAVQLRQGSVEFLVQGLLRDQEVRAVAKLQANVSSTARYTGASAWDAVNSADILTQVLDARVFMQSQTGLRPNAMVIDWRSLQYARRNAFAKDYFKYTKGGFLSNADMMELWELDNLYVARSFKNNAAEGATASLTSIWGPSAFLFVEGAASVRTVAYGLGFRWQPEGMPAAFAVSRQVQAGAGTRNVEVLEAGYYQDEKVISSALGYLINTKSGNVW